MVADNGAFGGPAYGDPRALTTRASEPRSPTAPSPARRAPTAPGAVNLPDTSGNPVAGAAGVATDGERALYEVHGGAGPSPTGSAGNYLLAARPPGAHPEEGWRAESVLPPRDRAPHDFWRQPAADASLSTLLGLNFDNIVGEGAPNALWRLPTSGGAAAKLYESPPGAYNNGPYLASADASRALLVMGGEDLDPTRIAVRRPPALRRLLGDAGMASLLPGGEAPSCG